MNTGESPIAGTCLPWPAIRFEIIFLAILIATVSGRSDTLQERPIGCEAPAAKLQFTDQPNESEVSNARVFDEPLIPIGGEPTLIENKAMADALAVYTSRTNLDDFSSLTGFLARFPESPWTGSLLLHLGTEYYNFGYYSKALDVWEKAWQNLKDSDDPKGKPQADRALGELARMYSKLGRIGELNDLLASVTNRSVTGPGVQLIHSAHEALWMM